MTYAHRFLTGILAGLSLLLLPVAACVCEEHTEVRKEQTAVHCHAAHSEHESRAVDFQLSHQHECACFGLSARAIAKAEGIKLQKHEIAPSTLPETQTSVTISPTSEIFVSQNRDDFRQPFLASKPSRGPPLT